MSIAYSWSMSPAPARTSLDAIVAAARAILESDGLPAVTMGRVADAVGVRAPSLYKRVANRDELIRAVSEGVLADLSRAIGRATETDDPRADLRTAANSYRDFVLRNPNGYRLLFADLPAAARPDPAAVAASGLPIVRAMAQLIGESKALEGARTMVAWAHGFVSMELAGGFRLGGDVEVAYAFGIESMLAGVSEAVRRA
jgi:AcrR family transcriptional regulator